MVFGVEMKIVNDEGIEQAADGVQVEQLLLRGPCIASAHSDRHNK